MMISQTTSFNDLDIKKVIIWGHKLHSHTHSYIHLGYFRAFQYLGYKTYWFDDYDKIKNFDFSNSLFFTEGQVDKKIPIRKDCYYILHYCYKPKYDAILEPKNYIELETSIHDIVDDGRNYEIIDKRTGIYSSMENRRIYMPWATDLLPHEIDQNKERLKNIKRKQYAVFIGTLWGGKFGNISQLEPFIKACKENQIEFKHAYRTLSLEDNMRMVQESYMAPAIQGKFQCDKGLVTDRIMKNISYGQVGITNNLAAYELFNRQILYNSDTYQLFFDAQKYIENLKLTDLYKLMDFVKTHHTYINRIHTLLSFFSELNRS